MQLLTVLTQVNSPLRPFPLIAKWPDSIKFGDMLTDLKSAIELQSAAFMQETS